MSRKRYTPEQIIHHLRPVDVLLGKGTKVPELCKQLELPPAFSAKKISGTVYTKLGVAGGARVPPVDTSFRPPLVCRHGESVRALVTSTIMFAPDNLRRTMRPALGRDHGAAGS